ncbi:protein kinase [Rhodococcus sp. NCIMB 12038]|uniref:protein kinase domain-containing protein n=1 Tax=Rhodococcus sp. NCIMB 12038 TaxID=933800 RepID=UPI001C4F7DD7|nr:protein kinase [Rhodococcus sp. NCIMB 12038]
MTLSLVEGPADQQEYVFSERSTCLVGRSHDCQVRIPSGAPDADWVSRHHCLLDINPPDIRVRDFGSLNGTHVNGEEIGRRKDGQTPEEGAATAFPERALRHGDQIKMGPTVLRVDLANELGLGNEKLEMIRCSRCGSTVLGETAHRDGKLVCESCQSDLGACVADLLRKADDGAAELAAIRGYDLVQELGRGGQGIVFLARHKQTGELTAVKVLLAQVAASPHARAQFLREMSSVASLRHPNIVAFREAGESGGQFFFTCDYCDGGSVADLVRERGHPLSVEDAVAFTLQVLAGLDYAHTAPLVVPGQPDSRGLVHRDIKPANILLTRSDSGGMTARLADFGLAKAFDLAGLSGHTFTGDYGGTVAFMSRAQLTDFKYAQPAVDVWSTAASLYWMLTEMPPRDFPAGKEPVLAVLQDDPVPIRERNPHIPAPLAEAIDNALVDLPENEVCTAEQFAHALREAW